ncbi:MAG: FprA family A-type flavoprotein [Candidatus Magnetomorum sp.]|nr:FprA family A-type flavoprotein [Candidatus Magnetomorum sp.]
MRTLKISEGIYDVGVNDWNIRDFHGYLTPTGTSYNAYLIVDEKIALIDTVKKEFSEQLMNNISTIIDPKTIDYVISNHTEMDHSGSLPKVMHAIGEQKPLFCSKMGLKNLSMHYSQKWNYHAVENGEELSLGKKQLTFLETRMLHWPDSMFTYEKTGKILFSSDAFGQHYAGYEKFDDQMDHETIMQHSKKYFANILLLYAGQVKKLLKTIDDMKLEFDIICPDHGIIWRKNPGAIIEAYEKWSEHPTRQKAIVIYDTMWQSTKLMAEYISQGISSEGVTVRPMHLRTNHRSDIMTEILDAAAIIVGSPTLNNNIYPTISDFLTYMKGLRPQNKLAACFGSYGWNGAAIKILTSELASMNFQMLEDSGFKIQYVPDEKGLTECYEFGKNIGKAICK